MFKIIEVFNHKGGVSKTTTTFNLAWKLTEFNKKVLVVDGDPQCNLSELFMGDSFESYYDNTDTKDQNIKDAVSDAYNGRPYPIKKIKCPMHINNENLYLLPGHMDLSEYEASLSLSMNSNGAITTLQNLPGAIYELIKLCCEEYGIDYVFIDMNPGLTAMNEMFFTYCDDFIVPTNPDPFSVMALKTLSKTLPRWKQWSENTKQIFSDTSYPLPDSSMMFLGEIIQRFSMRMGKPSHSYEGKIDDIKKCIDTDFIPVMEKNEMLNPIIASNRRNHCLGEIPDFQSLIQRANEAMVPVYALSAKQMKAQGYVYENMEKSRQRFTTMFNDIANLIIEATNEASVG